MDIEKLMNWLAIAASHPNNSADDEAEIYEFMEKLEGRVEVPVEPTIDMIDAAAKEHSLNGASYKRYL